MQSENKDTSIIFSRKLSNFSQPPSDNSRYLIKKNLKKFIELICYDASLFQHSIKTKLRSLSQLKHTIILAEESVAEHFEDIIRMLIKLYQKEDAELDREIKGIAEVLGLYNKISVYLPILIKIMNEEEYKTSTRLTSSALEVSGCLLLGESQESLINESELIIKLIGEVENQHNENTDIMFAGFNIVCSFIMIGKEASSKYRTELFSYLLTIQSVPNLTKDLKDKVEQVIALLANVCGYKNLSEIYAVEVSSIMKEFYESKSYKEWTPYSKDRYKFDVIVRNCGIGLADVLDTVLEILEAMVAPNNELEMKIDALGLVEFLMSLDELSEQIKLMSFRIMTKILIPCAVWKAGKPYIKIRKASVICMIKIIQSKLISEESLFQCVSDLKPMLKTCLNDDWAPDLRHHSCVLLEAVFITLKEILPDLDLKDLYPHLLERLDDSQDLIRVEITKAIKAFFQCEHLRMSPGTLEYVIKNLLIHLDDQNEKLQLAIFHVLKEAAEINPKITLTEAKLSVTKQKYPQFCQQLIKWIEENLYEKLKAIENKEIEDKIKSEEEEQQQNKMVNENTQ